MAKGYYGEFIMNRFSKSDQLSNAIAGVLLIFSLLFILNFWFFGSLPFWIALDTVVIVVGVGFAAAYFKRWCTLPMAVAFVIPAVATAIIAGIQFLDNPAWAYVDIYVVIVYAFIAGVLAKLPQR